MKIKKQNSMPTSKKGSTFDILLGLVVLMVGGVFILVLMNFYGQIRDSGIKDALPEGRATLDDFDAHTVWTFDFMLVMMFVAFFGGAVILAAFARHHPLLAWVNILILIILVMVSVPISNGYTSLVTENSLSAEAGKIGVFNLIMANLPMLTIIFAAFLVLAMFAFKSEVGTI